MCHSSDGSISLFLWICAKVILKNKQKGDQCTGVGEGQQEGYGVVMTEPEGYTKIKVRN